MITCDGLYVKCFMIPLMRDRLHLIMFMLCDVLNTICLSSWEPQRSPRTQETQENAGGLARKMPFLWPILTHDRLSVMSCANIVSAYKCTRLGEVIFTTRDTEQCSQAISCMVRCDGLSVKYCMVTLMCDRLHLIMFSLCDGFSHVIGCAWWIVHIYSICL